MAAIQSLTIRGAYVLLRRESATIYEVVDGGESDLAPGARVLVNSAVNRQEVYVAGERYEVFPASAVIGEIELAEE